MNNLVNLTKHAAVDTITQMSTRSSVVGGITLDEYSIAIDSGNPLHIGESFRKNLESFFIVPVKYLFLTHAHSDHRGGMDAFKDTTLILSEKCKQNMPKNTRFKDRIVETFEERFILEEGDVKVEFFHTAGHSLGSSVAYLVNERVLYAGDLFFTEPINFGLPFLGFYQSSPRKTGNPEECLAAFRKFQSMKVDYIVPGHGEVIRNPQEYLSNQIEFFESLKKFILSEIKEGKAIDEIELPRIGQIKRAYQIIETESQKSRALKFMDTMLNWIKRSFYEYYSSGESI